MDHWRRARPGDYSYNELIDWFIIFLKTDNVGPRKIQIQGIGVVTTAQGVIVDVWPMPTFLAQNVQDALDRLHQARQMLQEGRRRDMNDRGEMALDTHPMSNRFRSLTPPETIAAWEYNPEAWQPVGPQDDDIYEVLWPLMHLHGADNADLAAGSEAASSAASEAGSEVGATVQGIAALNLMSQMTMQHKSGKKGPSTACGSTAPTTVGNTTAAGTFTSAASTTEAMETEEC